jgi:hypothetical protein
MKDAQKPDHICLNTLIGRLKEGRYVIPDFQREFESRPWDIRHSRSVDEIIRKEGEAAILWFTQVLGKKAGEPIVSARQGTRA